MPIIRLALFLIFSNFMLVFSNDILYIEGDLATTWQNPAYLICHLKASAGYFAKLFKYRTATYANTG